MSTLYIIIIIVALVLILVGFYNGLVRARNRTQEAWADIEVQLKRRYDLIPNLVNTVKGYATHETTAFENVTKARTMAMNGGGAGHDHAEAENMLTGALKSIFAIAEAYPDLKANTNFIELQRELSDTENKIQSSRRFYNGVTNTYNTKIQMFPGNVFASMFSFKNIELFDLADNDVAQKNIEVKF
jgi:LemA protein